MPKSLVEGEASGCTEGVHFRSNSMNGRNGLIFVDPHPALKVWLQFHNGSLKKFPVGLSWVDSCPLANSYIESVHYVRVWAVTCRSKSASFHRAHAQATQFWQQRPVIGDQQTGRCLSADPLDPRGESRGLPGQTP